MSESKSGLLLVDKSTGLSSAAVIAQIKRKLPIFKHKIGHSGTLDPFASGLLAVLVGRATRLVPYIHDGWKEYTGEILLGRSTDSDDSTGNILSERTPPILSEEECEAIACRFRGDIEQTPPRVSAVKIDGKRAYERARAGEDFTIKSKTVHIEHFEISPTDIPGTLQFVVRSSGGTYIRSLARDIGEQLGVGGCLSSLRRTAVQPFRVEQCKTVEDLLEEDLFPWEIVCQDAARVWFSSQEISNLLCGKQDFLRSDTVHEQAMEAHQNTPGAREDFLLYGDKQTGRLIGLLRRTNQRYWEIAVNIEQENPLSGSSREETCHHLPS